MAREGRRVVLAALAAAALGAACVLTANAQSNKEDSKAPAKKKQDPVEAQRAIDAAAKLLQAGKADPAVQSLTATLSGGNLPPAVMAKALYMRGLGYRQQKKPAHALSDLTSALWLKGGLGGDERADAIKQRTAAYSDAGLTERGEVVVGAIPESPPPASAKKSGGGWLGNIFGSPDSPAPPTNRPKVAAAIEKAEAPAAPKAPKPLGGWGSNTQVQVDREALAAPATVQPPKSEAPPAGEEGRFRVQLAAVRTEAEAMALAAKAKREHAAVLAASAPQIEKAVLGNMGSFYRVRFGPFATEQETQAVCAKLKSSGFDCLPVHP
jgi:hypothetical protein